MNLKKFKENIDNIYENHSDEAENLQVVIEVNEPSIGASAFVNIKSIHKGFDWNNWKVSLYPEQPIVCKTNKRQIKINNEESAFRKELINVLEKNQPERQTKLILEVLKCIEKHFPQKKIKK